MNEKRKRKLKDEIKQFLQFGIVGITNTLIAFSVYYILIFNDVHYLIANLLGWAIGVFNGFYWNYKYVFKNNVVWWKSLLKTYMSYGLSFFAGVILLYVIVEFMYITPVIAPVICLLVTVPLNFLLNKFWAFK